MSDEQRLDDPVRTAGLRVYLSLEAEPPFVVAGQQGMFENYVPFSTSKAGVLRAAGELSSELSAYPVRA